MLALGGKCDRLIANYKVWTATVLAIFRFERCA
jgi:hypothetical protein